MSANTKRYTITAALPYANGPLHIGHIAGAYLPADIYARYQRLRGKDVAFICGSDEHGAAITLRAIKEDTTPQAIVDQYHEINKKAFSDFGIEFDTYDRTSSDLHKETAQEFFLDLYNKGEFTQETRAQFYDEKFEKFLADRYVIGECPNCHSDHARGDECEKCNAQYDATELINPKSALSGETPILKDTTHWYLPMEKHEKWLQSWIEEGKLNGKQHHNVKEWKNQVIGQCKSWIDNGLRPRAITRDLEWGVSIPVEGGEGKVLYVWFDAPIGYISATKKWAEENNKSWEDYWKKDDTKLVHFIGKDNIVFHCIIFPIILKLKGDFILPDNVPANEFLNLEGGKLSTSRKWAVWLHEYLEDFPDRQDELRYVLASIAPENKDSEFTWDDYRTRVHSELGDILGNFVNRVLVLTTKNTDGKVQERGELEQIDEEVIKEMDEIQSRIEKAMELYRFREAQAEAMNLARAGNKYFTDTAPWHLVKTDPARLDTILNIGLQIAANLSIALEPFLPHTCTKIRSYLNLEKKDWDQLGSIELLKPGQEIVKGPLLFAKIEDEEIAKQVEKLEKTKLEVKTNDVTVETDQKEEAETVAVKEECTFDDFVKMDIRVGKIIAAEKVKKADKLLNLTIETGIDTRTILSGIAEHFTPEEIVGKEVSVLVNLAPRKMRGIESQGMVLMAEDAEGNLTFVAPEKSVEAGSVIR